MFILAFQFPLIAVLAISGTSGQTVHTDSDRSGYVGTQVELRCHFANSKPPVKISQVTWQKSVNGTKQNVAIANPALGVSMLPDYKDRVRFKNPAVRQRTPSLEDTTIIFNNLKLSDEATYICEYTTFPAGNRESMVNLTVYARPMVQMSLSTPTIVAGSKDMKMTVATCVSANGKPPAVITWDTELNGEANTEEIKNTDGTITVRSDYIMTPSREANEQRLTCISTYNNDQQTDDVILNVQYEPEVSIEGFDGNWYINRENVQLTCLADANPAVSSFQWRYLNGSMPNTAEQREETLIFKGPVTYEMAGTYMCDATNIVGAGSASVEVIIIGPALLPPTKSLLLKRSQQMTSRTRARYMTSFPTQLSMPVIICRVIRMTVQKSTLHPSSHHLHFCPSTHAPRTTCSRTLHHLGLTLHIPSLKNSWMLSCEC
ncbi:nectin cell adhesion molecule 1a isoform X4 [Neoarius graeffei]|uniref:nectin cell adhesion molecule 1a isoform X4 n=1 Tax=Neoarius graeffei TaxID=443677 RepID=UPI00298CD80F|nr:nectin cell adhesion molecule 1a isoform X4 [Neoarius graeffei]